jgi:glycosyltransferase involved in cell wall biosynthesis
MSVHSTAYGGAERCALAEAERLAPTYRLIIAAPAGPLLADLADYGKVVDGPPLLPTWGGTPRRWTVQLTRSALDTLRLVRLIHREQVDAVVCNSSVAFSPVLAARLTRRPVLVHLRDSPNSRLARPLIRLEASLANIVAPVSNNLTKLCGRTPRARVVQIPDGISIPKLTQSRPPFHNPLRLGVIGAIDHGKGQDVAVRAVAELLAAGVAAELHLVGREQDSGYAADLRATVRVSGVERFVHFHGEQRNLEPIYSDLDVLLLPSRREAFGLVVLEALARCLPVVAVRVGSVPELLLSGEAGLIVDPDDPSALAAGVLTLKDDVQLACSLASRGRRHVVENYDLETTLERGCAEIARILGGSRDIEASLPRDGSVPSHLPSDQRANGELLSGK